MPTTRLGRWSALLIVLFFILFMVMQYLVSSGQMGGETFFSSPVLAVTGILIAASGILAFFTGIISIIKGQERSVFVFFSSIVGLFVFIFVIREVIF